MACVRFRHLAPLLVAAVCALAAPVASADCVDGVRQPTPAEREAAQRARAALIAGLPEAVRPLERRAPGRSDPSEPVSLSFCGGTPLNTFGATAVDGYRYEFTKEEAAARSAQRRALLRQVEDIETLPPEKEAQRKEIETQMRAAYAAAPTRSRKDPPFTPEQQAQVDRAQAEGRKLEEAMRRIEIEHRASVRPQTDPLRARADDLQQGPQMFSVALQINLARFPDPLPEARGVLLTFGEPRAKPGPLPAALYPANVVVRVEGPAGPARDALVGLIDRAYLAGLVMKPLPDVAVSKQRIDANIAQAASAPPLVIASTVPLDGSATAAAAAAQAASPAAAPSTAAPVVPAAATTPAAQVAAQRSTSAAPCPPPARTASNNDAQRSGSQVGAEVGGAVLGGGWGRSVGASVGGVLGALGGGAQKPEQKPAAAANDCPR
jgi:hypothetical protein